LSDVIKNNSIMYINLIPSKAEMDRYKDEEGRCAATSDVPYLQSSPGH
jgi:hypothetical protein